MDKQVLSNIQDHDPRLWTQLFRLSNWNFFKQWLLNTYGEAIYNEYMGDE